MIASWQSLFACSPKTNLNVRHVSRSLWRRALWTKCSLHCGESQETVCLSSKCPVHRWSLWQEQRLCSRYSVFTSEVLCVQQRSSAVDFCWFDTNQFNILLNSDVSWSTSRRPYLLKPFLYSDVRKLLWTSFACLTGVQLMEVDLADTVPFVCLLKAHSHTPANFIAMTLTKHSVSCSFCAYLFFQTRGTFYIFYLFIFMWQLFAELCRIIDASKYWYHPSSIILFLSVV